MQKVARVVAARSSRAIGAAPLQNRTADLAHFICLSFVLTAQLQAFLFPIAVQRRAAKILEHKCLATTENLHPLFGHGLISFSEIGDRPIRSVSETKGDKNRVLVDDLMIAAGDRFRV